jgi:glycosyltransferase involved in cell wall biosynthesis
MKLAIATTFDARDVANWSGTPFYMANAFEQSGVNVDYIGNLKRKTEPFFKIKKVWKKFASDQRESPRFNIHTAKHYSAQAAAHLKQLSVDAIIAPQIHPICYLESNKPIILWTDGLYASLIGFYPGFSSHSASSIKQGNIITSECLSRCSLAIFSSDWAARTAIEIYGADKNKVKVVPFGANIPVRNSLNDIRDMLKSRSRDTAKLLFIGKHWDRKGGAIVFDTAKALHAAGQAVELNFIGCMPPSRTEIPNYIKCHGFISKRTPDGVEKIKTLLRESHFLFVPSRAEAYGIVFCEANAFALPCLTTHVGGISTIIKDHLNGMTFALDAPISAYRDYIMELMQHYSRYEEMALNAFQEFENRLNWQVAVDRVKSML